jgi:hypothetical protein
MKDGGRVRFPFRLAAKLHENEYCRANRHQPNHGSGDGQSRVQWT